MRNSQNHKKTVNYFFGGADYDISRDLAGAKQGFYKDANNMRLYSRTGSIKRIYGEALKYYTINKNFTCIGATEVNYNIFEIWVSDDNITVRFRINGYVMLETTTSELKFNTTRKLQIDKADDCNGGLVFMTDNSDVPYIFSCQDIIDSFTANGINSKYFDPLFNSTLYSVNLFSPQNIPVFRRLTTSGALPCGEYSYSLRFVDSTENRTLFGIPTPMIPVPLKYSKGSAIYPYHETHGGTIGQISPYGIEIQFRVDNILNYSYIEIRRVKVNSGLALNETPIAQVRPIFPNLLPNEVSVRTFIDDGNSETEWVDLTDDESTDTMAAIESCKSIRYFNNQLVLGNVKLASKDITGEITFNEYHTPDKPIAFPFIDNLGDKGYYSPYNTAYKRSYMGGEKYGFGVACLDWQNNICFIVPIDNGTVNFDNYQFPERRDPCTADLTASGQATFNLSEGYWKGVPRAADVNNNSGVHNEGVPVHEKFSKIVKVGGEINKSYFTVADSVRSIKDGTYYPYTPIAFNDTNNYGLSINPNNQVATNFFTGTNASASGNSDAHFYSPDFSLEYYGMGIAISGISSLPTWVNSFCIVRTNAAGRVVCQGITTYNITDTPQTHSNIYNHLLYNTVSKDGNKVCFYSDDLHSGYVGYTDNSFSNYKFKPVSPLGYFSEMYSGKDESGFPNYSMYSKGIDAVIYARDFYTDPSYKGSINLYDSEGVLPYYTKFGKWRNAIAEQFVGTKTFGIQTDIQATFKGVGQETYLNITFDALSGNLYQWSQPQSIGFNGVVNQFDCNDPLTKLWHEPFYISNIIDESKEVPDVNSQQYILTGNYQKISSKIADGSTQIQPIPLVDERWEDCSINPFWGDRDTYVYVKDKTTGIEKAWIDITIQYTDENGNVLAIAPRNAAWVQAVITSINANGYYDSTDPYTGVVTRCYGVYKSEWIYTLVETGNVSLRFELINGLTSEFCLPNDNSEIIVKYDNRFPIKVFGGDTVIGESEFAWVDGQSDSNAGIPSNNQLFAWVGFPYSAYHHWEQLDDATSGSEQAEKFIPSNIFRQIIVSSIVESRVHLPYSYTLQNSSGAEFYTNFPRRHYTQRPFQWDNSNIGSNFGSGKIDNQYQTDFPYETNVWNRGGFRFIQAVNIDYSKSDNYNKYFSKPQVGFVEKTYFCTRVMWSLPNNINVQNDPNLKTFLSLNVFDISDIQGEIKFLYDNDSGKGNNIFAITDSGICLLVTAKKTISDTTANELFVVDSSKLVSDQYWISKTVGCSAEMWKGIAEYNNLFFFPNSESVYMLMGLELKDILRENEGSYYDRLHPILQSVLTTTPMTGVYNVDNDEYWLYIATTKPVSPYDGSETIDGIDSNIISPQKLVRGGVLDSELTPRIDYEKSYNGETYVYKADKKVFTGTFDYRGDKFLCVQGNNTAKGLSVLIMRNYETYLTNTGNTLNGGDIMGSVKFVIAPEGHLVKEFIDQTINCSILPTQANITNNVLTEASQTYFKNYGNGYYYQVPRKTAVPHFRMQGRNLTVEIFNDTVGEWEVVSTETGYKIII